MTQTTEPTASQLVHNKLYHPVIDADGHYVEFMPRGRCPRPRTGNIREGVGPGGLSLTRTVPVFSGGSP